MSENEEAVARLLAGVCEFLDGVRVSVLIICCGRDCPQGKVFDQSLITGVAAALKNEPIAVLRIYMHAQCCTQ